jgi:peroxiredoxin
MIKKYLLFLFLFLYGSVFSQNVIDGTIHNLGKSRLFLLSIYGERTKVADSVLSDSLGRFHMIIPAESLPGLYRLSWSKSGFINFLINKEDISFETDARQPEDSLKIKASLENQLLNYFSGMLKLNQSKLELLMPVVDYYPVKDEFYKHAVNELEAIQKAQIFALDSLASKYPSSFAVRIQKSMQTPYLPGSLTRNARLEYLRQHYWDNVDFNDTALLRSNLFVDKVIAFLAVYHDNRLNQKQLEAEFIKAVSVALGAASVNTETYKFMLDYLVGGFDKYHFDDVITYIAENFQDPYSCEDAARKSALQKKLDNFKKLAIGKPAPGIEVPDQKGINTKLLTIPNEYTLLIFWMSECPHCTDMMPKLKALYDKQNPRKLQVMAVSLDTSRNAWTSYIKKEKLNWINVSDLKGFSGKAEDEYNVYATPTMYLLDREKNIISKPITWRELEQSLRENKIINY